MISEYETLRQEMLYYVKTRDQITTYVLTTSYGAFVLELLRSQTIVIFYLAILLSLFAYIFFTVRTLYILKIDSYIRVILEKQGGEWQWHRMKYNYPMGVIYHIGQISSFVMFVIPIAFSFIEILLLRPEVVHWALLIAVIALVLVIELSKQRNKKLLDHRWGVQCE